MPLRHAFKDECNGGPQLTPCKARKVIILERRLWKTVPLTYSVPSRIVALTCSRIQGGAIMIGGGAINIAVIVRDVCAVATMV